MNEIEDFSSNLNLDNEKFKDVKSSIKSDSKTNKKNKYTYK
jgi:hypothetical protein